MDLFKYSDNSKNRYSDNYYRAALVDALAAAISPAPVQHDPATITSDTLTEDTRRILTEVCLFSVIGSFFFPFFSLRVTIAGNQLLRVYVTLGNWFLLTVKTLVTAFVIYVFC